MRGDEDLQEGMFSLFPRIIRCDRSSNMVDEILKEISPKFARLYSDVGRPSERLLRSLLLQDFYTTCCFRGLWAWRWKRWYGVTRCTTRIASVCRTKRSRNRFFQRVLERARPYMSDEHFTVDEKLIEAWAS
jgi:hypothetical protein